MIIDYNYKKSIESFSDSSPFTISRKNNKGFIYYPGTNDSGNLIWPTVYFSDENDNLTSLNIQAPSISIFSLYMHHKVDSTLSSGRPCDLSLIANIVGGSASTQKNNGIFMPICFYKMEIDPQVVDPLSYDAYPTLITLY
jgi:hypothetical protein